VRAEALACPRPAAHLTALKNALRNIRSSGPPRRARWLEHRQSFEDNGISGSKGPDRRPAFDDAIRSFSAMDAGATGEATASTRRRAKAAPWW
jgi:hypothetical protein